MTSSTPALSSEMEDYLEAIAELFRLHGKARVTDIAEHLSVRKASVTQALHTLADRGLVRYRPYAPPRLTATGGRIAAQIQQRHDVLKRFLVEVLQIDPATADANACRLEHAVDKEVLERLTHFVDFLQTCPRGGVKWIRGYEHACDPAEEAERCERCLEMALEDFRSQRNKDEATEDKPTMTLHELQAGQTARIVKVGKVGSIRRRIVDMGAVKGTKVTMVKVAPLGDPMEVKIKGYSLTLRRREAEAITVQALDTVGA